MSTSHCVGCQEEHDSWAWKYSPEYAGWVCTKFFKPSGAKEWIPESVKDERKEYFNSIVQPFRDGEVSKEYIEAHGAESINVTPEEAEKAENVWQDVDGFNTREDSK